MMSLLSVLISGILFGLGLSIAQMINPNKVLGFLDIIGDWDPSLALVMAAALSVAGSGFYWVKKHGQPLLDNRFHFADKTQIDRPLLIGAAIFGMGWGLTGYCPGPAVANLALGNGEAVIMVVSIYVGFWAAGLLNRKA